MDNLTHSLAGAVLGQMGLKQKTGLGMATLIIAANIPDIDAAATLLDGVQHLAIRRGITHGPIAMLLLPLILTVIMIGFDRWQLKRGTRPADRLPIHKGWLLALAYIGCLSHPALDWLNSYGIRLLEPFSSQWFYGDSIFIIDIWIWIAFISGLWISRRREKKGDANWQRPAWISFAVICAYIFGNGLITGKAEADTRLVVEQQYGETPSAVVANPLPFLFWQREMLIQSGNRYRQWSFDLTSRSPVSDNDAVFISDTDPDVVAQASGQHRHLRDFLFWSRMPLIGIETQAQAIEVSVSDMRFQHELAIDRFRVSATVPKDRLDEPAE
jgi:inner membrane protein